jgi:hypothetical protein
MYGIGGTGFLNLMKFKYYNFKVWGYFAKYSVISIFEGDALRPAEKFNNKKWSQQEITLGNDKTFGKKVLINFIL